MEQSHLVVKELGSRENKLAMMVCWLLQLFCCLNVPDLQVNYYVLCASLPETTIALTT